MQIMFSSKVKNQVVPDQIMNYTMKDSMIMSNSMTWIMWKPKTSSLRPPPCHLADHLQDIEIVMSSYQLLPKDCSQILNSQLNSLFNIQQALPDLIMTQMIRQIILTSLLTKYFHYSGSGVIFITYVCCFG